MSLTPDRKRLLTAIIILLSLILLVFIVRWSAIYPSVAAADVGLLGFLNRHRIRELDPVFMALSDATTFISVGINLSILALAWKQQSGRMLHQGIQLALTLVSVLGIVSLLKYAITRQRPFEIHDFVEKLSGGGGPSFPSGHTTEVFALTTVLFLLYPGRRWIAAIALCWAFIVGYTRMLLGVHYPSDILGGILFGVLTAMTIHLAYNQGQSGGNAG